MLSSGCQAAMRQHCVMHVCTASDGWCRRIENGWYSKSEQKEAILSFLSGRDTLVVLPMGYGKSLIYATLPLLFDKLKSVSL